MGVFANFNTDCGYSRVIVYIMVNFSSDGDISFDGGREVGGGLWLLTTRKQQVVLPARDLNLVNQATQTADPK